MRHAPNSPTQRSISCVKKFPEVGRTYAIRSPTISASYRPRIFGLSRERSIVQIRRQTPGGSRQAPETGGRRQEAGGRRQEFKAACRHSCRHASGVGNYGSFLLFLRLRAVRHYPPGSRHYPPCVTIWTDGACSSNPDPGGWGAILRFGHSEKEFSGGQKLTTNNGWRSWRRSRGSRR
jgi:hypothetical protein